MTIALIIVVAVVACIWAWRHGEFQRDKQREPALHATDKVHPPPADSAKAAAPSPKRLWRVGDLTATAGSDPLVSVCIPARNEGHNISRALDSVLLQDHESFEVIVVDDHSEDDTAVIVSRYARNDSRVRLVRSDDIPEGWTGKTNTLQSAARHARGDILLFMDADVALDPGALAVMTSYFLVHHVDMLSLLLRLKSDSFWEKAVRGLAATTLLVRYPLDRVNDPKSPVAFANGQLIMIRAEVYRAVGGHESVKNSLLEDVHFAKHVKTQGYRLVVAFGFDMGETRMYASLRDHWNGWSRIFCMILDGYLPRMIAAVCILLVTTVSAYAGLLYSAAATLFGSTRDAAMTSLLVLSILQVTHMNIVMARVARFSRSQARYVALHFPATLITIGILLSAIRRRLSPGGLVWKGRRYDVRRKTQTVLQTDSRD